MDPNNPPENNKATLSWYENFNLRVVYNPALNPRAPNRFTNGDGGLFDARPPSAPA